MFFVAYDAAMMLMPYAIYADIDADADAAATP